MNLVEVLVDPADPEHEELRAWMDKTHGPDWLGPLAPAGFDTLV